MSAPADKNYSIIHFIANYDKKGDRFLISNQSVTSEKKAWKNRSTLLDSHPGYLELHEFLYPQDHQKPLNYFDLPLSPKSPNSIHERKESPKRTFDNIDKASREDLYSEKRYPIISRFNLDSKTNYIYLNVSKVPEENVVDIIDGCSLYSIVPGIEPFSLGESNLVQAALDEGLLGQAIQLTSFFSSSFKMYPEPGKAFDLLVKCIDVVDKYISKKKPQSLPGESKQSSNTNITPSLTRSQGPSSNDLSTEGLDKVLNAMARLLENLRAYLNPLYFYEMLSPLFKLMTLAAIPPKKYPVKMNLWQWIEFLGKLQNETSDAPSTLAISSGQLLAVLIAILHDDFKTKGMLQINLSMLVQLLPGNGFFPCTKLEQALDGLQFCKFKSSSGQAWISAMFHLQYLLVLLSHANIASADTIRYLTHAHYLRTDSLYSKRRFLQSIISLPFKCQLIDFALKESFTPLHKDNVRGWIGWKCLKDGHLKVSFEQVLAIIMKRIAPNVKVQLEVRVTRNSHQISSETAKLVHEELEHHLRMLHMLIFSYFFYRSKTHHPTNEPDHNKDSYLSPIMDELRTSLHELGQSLPSVEKFLATSLKFKPTLVQQFDTLLENFPFSPIYIDQIIID